MNFISKKLQQKIITKNFLVNIYCVKMHFMEKSYDKKVQPKKCIAIYGKKCLQEIILKK